MWDNVWGVVQLVFLPGGKVMTVHKPGELHVYNSINSKSQVREEKGCDEGGFGVGWGWFGRPFRRGLGMWIHAMAWRGPHSGACGCGRPSATGGTGDLDRMMGHGMDG